MRKFASLYLTITWIFIIGWGSLGQIAQASEPEPSSRITVYVYNYAVVDESTLQRAQSVVRYIFREAGVEAVLLDVPLPFEEDQTQEGEPLGLSDFFIHILTAKLAEPLGLGCNALGLAPGVPNERNRNLAFVFDQVAERMANELAVVQRSALTAHIAYKGQILGYGMAHEIGHLLLGSSPHASAGIMRARWDRRDLYDITSVSFLFTPEEVRQLRAEVVRRTGVQAARKIAALRSPQSAP